VEAQQVIAEARQFADRLQTDILMLQSRKEAFIKKLKYLLQSQQDLVQVLEVEDFEAPANLSGRLHEQHPPAVS
jgi:hypothetical protein